MSNICYVDNCLNKVFCQELCQKHYARFKRNGTTNLIRKKSNTKCLAKDCDNKVKALGLCSGHWRRFKVFGDIKENTPLRKINPGGPICAVDGCERNSKGSLYCNMHQKEDTELEM